MSNMSYARFQNTLEDLCDCKIALFDMSNLDDLSKDEKRAAIMLINVCKTIAEEFGDWTEED